MIKKYYPLLLGVICILFLLSPNTAHAAFNFETFQYTGNSLSIVARDGLASGIQFNSDGTKLYVGGRITDSIFQYSLATPYDITTATYDEISFEVPDGDNPYGFIFGDGGSKLFVLDSAFKTVYQYSLTTPFDVSTATAEGSTSYNASAQFGFSPVAPTGISFSTDGTKMFLSEYYSEDIFQYTLSTPWDITSASYSGTSFSASAQMGDAYGHVFSSDGKSMILISDLTDRLFLYTLSTAWDLSTMSYSGTSGSVDVETGTPTAIATNAANDRLFVTDLSTDAIYEYRISPVPVIQTFSPADNASGVPSSANLVMTFSESVTAATGTISIFNAEDDSVFESISVDSEQVSGSGTNTITINPSGNFSELQGYYVFVSNTAFVNASGTPFAGISNSSTWNFVVADETFPTIESQLPINNATGTSVWANLSLTFNEVVTPTTGAISLYNALTNALVTSISVTSSEVTGGGTNTITVNPTAPLSPSTTYYVLVSAGSFEDGGNNAFAGITSSSTWRFTTDQAASPSGRVSVDPTSATVAEDGGTQVVTFTLDEPLITPIGEDEGLTMYIFSSDSNEFTLSTTTLVWANAEWAQQRSVTITGVNDDNIGSDGAVLYWVVSTTAEYYSGLTGAVSITLTDDDLDPPSSLVYTSPNTFTVNTTIATLSPIVTGIVSGFSISPALPAGLALNTLTGAISGTPVAAAAETTYTVTASNAAGDTTFDITITVVSDEEEEEENNNSSSRGGNTYNESNPLTRGVVEEKWNTQPTGQEKETQQTGSVGEQDQSNNPTTPIDPTQTLQCSSTVYLTNPVRFGSNNNPADVRLLEEFLNTYENAGLVVNGVYDQADLIAVIAWQEKYAASILAPWGLTQGTGYVYTTSLAKIKEIHEANCATATPTPPEPAAPAPSAQCLNTTQTLTLGMNNTLVTTAQQLLKTLGYFPADVNTTGYFGPITQTAVTAFQAANSIQQLGIIGPQTRARLNELGCS